MSKFLVNPPQASDQTLPTCPCLICSSPTRSLYNTIFQVTYHVCPHCHYIFKNPNQLIDHEAALKIYEAHNNSYEDPGYIAYFQRFLDAAVVPFVADGPLQVLDFGSGPQPVLAKHLESQYHHHLTIYDLFYAPNTVYQNRQYQLITCTEVIEHLEDPLVQMLEFERLLMPGGILALMTQFHPRSDEDFAKWHYMRDRSHIGFFVRETFEELAKRCGLTLVYCDDRTYVTFQKPNIALDGSCPLV